MYLKVYHIGAKTFSRTVKKPSRQVFESFEEFAILIRKEGELAVPESMITKHALANALKGLMPSTLLRKSPWAISARHAA